MRDAHLPPALAQRHSQVPYARVSVLCIVWLSIRGKEGGRRNSRAHAATPADSAQICRVVVPKLAFAIAACANTSATILTLFYQAILARAGSAAEDPSLAPFPDKRQPELEEATDSATESKLQDTVLDLDLAALPVDSRTCPCKQREGGATCICQVRWLALPSRDR